MILFQVLSLMVGLGVMFLCGSSNIDYQIYIEIMTRGFNSYYLLRAFFIYEYLSKANQISSILVEKTMKFFMNLAYFLSEVNFLVDI